MLFVSKIKVADDVTTDECDRRTDEVNCDPNQPDHMSSDTAAVDIGTGSVEKAEINEIESVAGPAVVDDMAVQKTLERQTESLYKRIQRLQCKQAQKHVTRHVSAFVKHEQIVSGIGCQASREPKCAPTIGYTNGRIKPPSFSCAEEKMKLLSKEDVQNLSTSELVSLVRRLENGGNPNSNASLENGTSSSSIPDNQLSTDDALRFLRDRPSCGPGEPVPSISQRTKSALSPKDALQATYTVGTLRATLENLETGYDSDATESSSGGESCDDLLPDDTSSYPSSSKYPNGQPANSFYVRKHGSSYPSHFRHRVNWRWAVDRGAIASRWMWLIAQVADLEFKIRQQNEMYRTLRQNKGPIILEANVAPRPVAPAPAAGAETEAGSVCASAGKEIQANDFIEVDCVRTLPVKQLRRRKLVRSVAALAGATRKTARLSTVQCVCNTLPPLVSPCLLCNGRYNYVQVVDTDCMPQYERVALLDSSCHPVLSLPNNVSLGLHFSKFLKKETIQKPVTAKAQYKKRKNTSVPTEYATKFGQEIRKNNHKKSQAIISSNKLRKKYDGTSKRKFNSHGSRGEQPAKKRAKRERHESSSNGSSESYSRRYSPIPSPYGSLESGHNGRQRVQRRRSEQEYDINNIVIPYGITSTTRIEAVQYKEIVTPKWRIIEDYAITDDKPPPVVEATDLLEVEDLSDVTFAERHLKCETDEKKRFHALRIVNSKNFAQT